MANGGSSGNELLNGGNTFGAAMTIGTNDAQSLNLETNNSTAMTILSNGNVGIGTTNPAYKLDVNGATRINSSLDVDGSIYVANGDINLASTYKFSGDSFKAVSTGSISSTAIGPDITPNVGVYFPSSNAMGMVIGGSEVMRIASTGRIGIGTTNPTATLQLKAGLATGSGAPFKFTAGTVLTTPENGAMEYDGTDYYLTNSAGTRKTIATTTGGALYSPYLYGGTTASQSLTLESTSNATKGAIIIAPTSSTSLVGIGTSSPSSNAKMTINYTGTSTIGSEYGVQSATAFTPVANSSTNYVGINSSVSASSSYSLNGTIYGMQGKVTSTGANTYSKVVGVRGYADSSASGNTVNSAMGGEFNVTSTGNGNIISAYGLNVSVTNTSSTLANGYGLYLGTINGSSSYGIYQSDSNNVNYFNGRVGVSVANPSAKLEIAGNLHVRPVDNFAGTSIDFSQSNHFLSSFSCDGSTAFNLNNIMDGNEYSLFVSSASHTGKCMFNLSGISTYKFNATNGTPGTTALYKFRKYGSTLLVEYTNFTYGM